jgi:hypothetical protein
MDLNFKKWLEHHPVGEPDQEILDPLMAKGKVGAMPTFSQPGSSELPPTKKKMKKK